MKQNDNPMYSPKKKTEKKTDMYIVSYFRKRGIIISLSDAQRINNALNKANLKYLGLRRGKNSLLLELKKTDRRAARRYRDKLVNISFTVFLDGVESICASWTKPKKDRFKEILKVYFRSHLAGFNGSDYLDCKPDSSKGEPIKVVLDGLPKNNRTNDIEIVPTIEIEVDKKSEAEKQPKSIIIPEAQKEEFLLELYKKCEIPVLDGQQVWLVPSNQIGNTRDMFECEYVALNKYPEVYETATRYDSWSKNDFISELNSEFLRKNRNTDKVSSIGSQLYDFLYSMKTGDYVVAYSEKNKDVLVGILGEIVPFDDKGSAYVRKVEWIDRVCATNDIYLFNELSGRRVIANISHLKDLVFRNFYPIYVSDKNLYLNLIKTDHESLALADIIALQNSILECTKMIATAYDVYDEKSVSIRMAVASPGPIQFLFMAQSFIQSVVFVFIVMTVCQALKGKKTGFSSWTSVLNDTVKSLSATAASISETLLNAEKLETEKLTQDKIKEEIKTEQTKQDLNRKEAQVLDRKISENENKRNVNFLLPNSVIQDRMIDEYKKNIRDASDKSNIKSPDDDRRDK